MSTHLTVEEADALDIICDINHISKYVLLHSFLLDCLEAKGVPVRWWKKRRLWSTFDGQWDC